MTIDGTTITVTPLGATFVPVTQAKAVVTAADMGSNFVQARAADPAGNIDFSDGNFLKKWTAATNSVSTLVNGGTGEISVTPNIALNAAGDVFIADRNASAILKYESATSTLSTIVTAVPKLDPSGVLPDGRQFADSIELKKILLADTDKFAAALTENLPRMPCVAA